jgi:hypothetical protein
MLVVSIGGTFSGHMMSLGHGWSRGHLIANVSHVMWIAASAIIGPTLMPFGVCSITPK